MKSLNDAWDWIEVARKKNYQHARRKIRMKDMTADRAIIRLIEEVGEISKAHTSKGNDLEEIADSMAILMHLTMIKGFTQDQLATMLLYKMKKRFRA